MKRSLLTIFLALAPMAHVAWADDAPTKEQLDAAKKAFGEGKQLHDQGKLPEAIEKFKESYRLSRNPVLLYNIALTLDENKQTDNALFYYRKFLSDAPADAAQRKAADDRVKQLEKEKLEADLNGKKPDTTEPAGNGTTETKKPDEPKKPVKIKPPGTYGPNDFQHQIVEEVPPGKPLDISAFVPEDSGFTVTLYYRGTGDATFVAKAMKWRYKELVARIPGAKISGSSIQYYVEVKDQAGAVVTRSGKSVSPNLVNISAGATPRFYPDMTDDGEQKSPTEMRHHDESEDPLNKNKQQVHDEEDTSKQSAAQTDMPAIKHDGVTDVGSEMFERAKWGSTISAAALVGLGVTFYVLASNQASALVADSKDCPGGGGPPCRAYDQSYDQALQDAGKRDQLISNVGLGLGAVATVVAGYFWYRQLTAKKHGELKTTAGKTASPEMSWIVAPSVTDTSAGAAALVRF